MAKRRRKTAPLGHLTTKEIDALQDRMDSIASKAYMLRAEGKTVEARAQTDRLHGALEAAEAIGAYCQCMYVTKKLRQCACGRTISAMVDRAKRKKAAYQRFKLRSESARR